MDDIKKFASPQLKKSSSTTLRSLKGLSQSFDRRSEIFRNDSMISPTNESPIKSPNLNRSVKIDSTLQNELKNIQNQMQDSFFGVKIQRKRYKGRKILCFSGYDACKWLSVKFGTTDKRVVISIGQELINLEIILSLQKDNIFKDKKELYYEFHESTKMSRLDLATSNRRLSVSVESNKFKSSPMVLRDTYESKFHFDGGSESTLNELELQISDYEKRVQEMRNKRDEAKKKEKRLESSRDEMASFFESLSDDIKKIESLNKLLLKGQSYQEAEQQKKSIEGLQLMIEQTFRENNDLRKKLDNMENKTNEVSREEVLISEHKVFDTDIERLRVFINSKVSYINTKNELGSNNVRKSMDSGLRILLEILKGSHESYQELLNRESVDDIVRAIIKQDQFIGKEFQQDLHQVLEFLNFWATDDDLYIRDWTTQEKGDKVDLRKQSLRNWGKKIKIQLPQDLKSKLNIVMTAFF